MIILLLRFIFIIYILTVGILAENVLVVFFHLERTWRSKILGIFAGFTTLGFFTGALLLFTTLSTIGIIGISVVNLMLHFVLSRLANEQVGSEENIEAA